MATYNNGACIGASGKPRRSYPDKSSADHAAAYVLLAHKKQVIPYLCDACGSWHVCPAERHTPNHSCRHCDKQSYDSEQSAERRAALREGEAGLWLRVYECPHGDGWHLTSRR